MQDVLFENINAPYVDDVYKGVCIYRYMCKAAG